jgi:hypothetical protein
MVAGISMTQMRTAPKRARIATASSWCRWQPARFLAEICLRIPPKLGGSTFDEPNDVRDCHLLLVEADRCRRNHGVQVDAPARNNYTPKPMTMRERPLASASWRRNETTSTP